MRTGTVAVLLSLVLTASVLDLFLGVIWVTALVGVLLLRRRIPLAPALVLLAVVVILVWGGRVGWFPPPAPLSYRSGWVPAWGDARPSSSPAEVARASRIAAAREELARSTREELRLTGQELEQRAGAVIGLSRRIEPLRSAAPREAGAVEGAARRLARTLAAPEFRDLEARRRAAAAHLEELDRRLGKARDESEAVSVLREADPVAMAHVSLRPVREDLAGAAAAMDGLVQALGGGVPAATATASSRVDQARGELRWEVQYALAGAPSVRLLRLEMRHFRSAAPAGVRLNVVYAAGGEPPRSVPPGAWLELDPAPRGVTIMLTWAESLAARRLTAPLRALAFDEVVVEAFAQDDDVQVTAALDGRGGIEIPLFVRLPPPRLTRAVISHQALYFSSRPGTVESGPEGDMWAPADEGRGPLRLELLPRSLFLRNSAFTWACGYLYRPNPATVVVAVGLAALALALIGRPRLTGAENQ